MLETDRLTLRLLSPDDAPFILALLNTPGWLTFIGDRGVNTLADAGQYIQTAASANNGQVDFGPYAVWLKNQQEPIGLCGLYKRPSLDDVDIGFAFLPDYAGNGYAYEAASALIAHCRNTTGLRRLAGITKPTNQRSIQLLEKLGLQFERPIRFGADGTENWLFGMSLT